MTSLYALGWTQHSVGSQNIRCIAIIQLLLGNMGMAGGGVNALRGHSNIQGLTDLGLLSHLLPGYLTLPTDGDPDLKTYLEKRTPKPLRPGQFNYLSNYPKFFVSLMKAWYGAAATKENDFGYDMLPKIDGGYDVLRVMELLVPGQGERLRLPGLQPALLLPRTRPRSLGGLRKLKFLVTIDPLVHRDRRVLAEPRRVQRRRSVPDPDRGLPAPLLLLRRGGRLPRLQRALAAVALEGRRAARRGQGGSGDRRRALPGVEEALRQGRRGLPRSHPQAHLALPHRRSRPRPTRWPGSSTARPWPTCPTRRTRAPSWLSQGEQVPGFAVLQADGSTACGCWIFAGSWTQAGNQMARRDAADPSGLGRHAGVGLVVAGQPAHPLQPRLLQRRGRALHRHPQARLVERDEVGRQRRPRLQGRLAPRRRHEPVHHDQRGRGPALGAGHDRRAVPRTLRALRHPARQEPVRQGAERPAARVFPDDWKAFGKPDEFPFVATTYRLTEHFHFWTKNARIPAILQPEAFVELPEGLAKKKGIRNDDWVVVKSKRGQIKLKALVTKRMPTLTVDGKEVEVVGLPIHWGFIGQTQKGYITNTLTPPVGDANIQTPEYKAFLVNVEKA